MQVVAQNRRQSPVELLCVSDDARSCVEDTLKLVCPEFYALVNLKPQ